MTLTYISCSSDFYTFYVNVPLSLGCMIRKDSAEDRAIRGNGTGLEYMCPTRHFVYIFFNPVFQVSTAKNEINLFNNHLFNCGSCNFCPSRPSAEFLYYMPTYVLLEKQTNKQKRKQTTLIQYFVLLVCFCVWVQLAPWMLVLVYAFSVCTVAQPGWVYTMRPIDILVSFLMAQ